MYAFCSYQKKGNVSQTHWAFTFSFPYLYTFYLHPLCQQRKGRKEKEPFNVIIFHASSQLRQGSNVNTKRQSKGPRVVSVPWNSFAFSLSWQLVLVQTKSVASGAVSAPRLTRQSLAHLILALSPAEPHPLWVPWSSVLPGHYECYLWRRWQRRVDTQVVCISSAHTHVPLSQCTLQKLKDKVLRIL